MYMVQTALLPLDSFSACSWWVIIYLAACQCIFNVQASQWWDGDANLKIDQIFPQTPAKLAVMRRTHEKNVCKIPNFT
jgi:hypothetical protein